MGNRRRTSVVGAAMAVIIAAAALAATVILPSGASSSNVYACLGSNGIVRSVIEAQSPPTWACQAGDRIVSWNATISPLAGVTTTTTRKTTTTTKATTTTKPATTTTKPATTTTKATTTTTTTVPRSGNCTAPVHSSSSETYSINIGSGGLWWVNNDAWSGSHGPQTIYVCSPSSWYAVSNQPNIGGQVETYPDTEYDVGGRDGGTTKTISQFKSITSTFSEAFPHVSGDEWDAAYDLWTNNWTNETMIWNEWSGNASYWPSQAKTALTIGGVPYHFLANGDELMFFRDTQVKSGSVNLLAVLQWEVAHGYAKSTDVPTQLEYGVEISGTAGRNMTFPMTGLTMSVS